MANGLTVEGIMQKLDDPDYDIATNQFELVSTVEVLYKKNPDHPVIRNMAEKMLLRLRAKYPHVYAVTVGAFKLIEGVVEAARGSMKTGVDNDGFIWLIRKN